MKVEHKQLGLHLELTSPRGANPDVHLLDFIHELSLNTLTEGEKDPVEGNVTGVK